MGTDSIHKGAYLVTVHDNCNPYGYLAGSYDTEKEALGHIKFQREHMGSKANWNILHIIDCKYLNPEIGRYEKTSDGSNS